MTKLPKNQKILNYHLIFSKFNIKTASHNLIDFISCDISDKQRMVVLVILKKIGGSSVVFDILGGISLY